MASPLRFDLLAHYFANDPVVGIVRDVARSAGLDAWLVGGAVRDPLLGRTPKDADFVYAATNNTAGLPALVARKLDAPLVRYEKHLPVERVIVDGQPYDFVRIADTGALPADLNRRDFPFNALALPLQGAAEAESVRDALIDLHDGLGALDRREVRFTSVDVIAEDPLRMLRAYRLALQLGFTLTSDAEAAIRAQAGLLAPGRVAGERIRDELVAILREPQSTSTLAAMGDAGLLGARFPTVDGMRGVDQNLYHHLPVYEHTLDCIRQLELILESLPPVMAPYAAEVAAMAADELVPGRPRVALMKLALLFHDLGKPGTRDVRPDGQVTFIGHDKLSMQLMAPYLEDLKLSSREIEYIDLLVGQHLRPGFLDLDAPGLPRMLHRYFVDLGDYGVDLALISIADRLGAQGPKVTAAINTRHWAIVERIARAYWRENALVVRPPDLVNGDDLIQALGITPGPEIGVLLRSIKEAQVEGTVATREEALAYAGKFLK